MGALTAASVVVGFLPGLLLMPIAAIEGELGFAPIAATLTGPLPGLEGWSPALLTLLALVLGAALAPWLRLGHRAGIVRTHVHQCGVVDLAPEAIRIGAADLFESPDAVIRRALFAPKGADGGETA
jgi:hypothetical protein